MLQLIKSDGLVCNGYKSEVTILSLCCENGSQSLRGRDESLSLFCPLLQGSVRLTMSWSWKSILALTREPKQLHLEILHFIYTDSL